MVSTDNSNLATDDISLGALLDTLSTAGNLPLVFHYDGRPLRAGYHVTEVKAGDFSALDCGANPEAWSEIFIQLLDVAETAPTHMPAARFSAIIRKVSDHVRLDGSARLTFEVSDGERPMSLYRAAAPALRDGALHIELSPRPASCKPRDRWLAGQQTSPNCCTPPTTPQACCG